MIHFPWRKRKPAPVQEGAERKLSYQCGAMQGIGSRQWQEDAYTLVNALDVTKAGKEGLLAVVADGMGGMQGGAQASAKAIAVAEADFAILDRTQPLEPQLVGCVEHACEQVYALLHGIGGSTMVSCMLYDQQLYYAGVGDSYLYLLRGGLLRRINREQNLRQKTWLQGIRRGCIDPAQADGSDPQMQAVTQFLGIDRLEDVDCLRRAMPLESGDVLLLCSDGVGGVLTPEEIAQCLSGKSANEACSALNSAVLQKQEPHQDNFTAIVIRCEK